MGNTILVRAEGFAPRCDVCCRDNMKEILVSDEMFVSKLEGIVQWLGDVREVWAKGKFRDYVGQIHQVMVNMLVASVAMPKSCDMQVRCDFLHGNGPKYTTGTSVRAIIIRRFERRGVAAEDGVQEAAGFAGLSNGLPSRKSLGVFLQECRLANIELSPIPPETVAEIESVSDSVSQVDAQISAGHVYDHVDIHVHRGRIFSVDAELVVGPSPDVFANVIENEKEG